MFEAKQEVYAVCRYGAYITKTVDRVTKTQAIVGHDRFDRTAGHSLHKHGTYSRIMLATPENKQLLDEAIERKKQRDAEKAAEEQARREKIAEQKRINMAAFKEAVPDLAIETKLLPDGSRLYSVLLPGRGTERGEIEFSQVFVRATDYVDMNYRTDEAERKVKIDTTWCTNKSESFPSCSGDRVYANEERSRLEEILCEVWLRTW